MNEKENELANEEGAEGEQGPRVIYLDYAATTPVHPDVILEMIPYFSENFANPSSLHSCGQQAKGAVEDARGKVANIIGAGCDEIVFTSGGTESDNLAIKGVAYANADKGNHIITTSIEHPAVREACKSLQSKGFEITFLPVDSYGMVDPQEVKKAITAKTILISVMHANNEVGTIQPIAEIGAIAKEKGVYFHTDAVQCVGHIPINVEELGVNLLSIAAHKLYGPKGVGALYVKDGTKILQLMNGGEQERNLRAGTENVPSIVGFGKAVDIAGEDLDVEAARLTALRDALIKGILEKVKHTCLIGHPTKRLPNNINIGIDFVRGDSVALALDVEGVAVSTGSACSSGNAGPSVVLLAMGLSKDDARSSVRFSLGRDTSQDVVNYVLEILPAVVERFRKMSPAYDKFLKEGGKGK